MVSSISATERMKIWDQFGTEPISDHEVIKLQFFRKIHSKNPPFRSKLKPKSRDEVEVPEVVRHHYENPPSLLPSLRDVLRVDNLRKRGTVHIDSTRDGVTQARVELDSMEAARKRLRNIFSDQEDVHGLLDELEVNHDEDRNEKLNKSKDNNVKRSKRARDLESSDEIIVELENLEAKKKDDQKSVCSETPFQISTDKENADHNLISSDQTATALQETSILQPSELLAIKEQLCNLSDETIMLLAYQRLSQVRN